MNKGEKRPKNRQQRTDGASRTQIENCMVKLNLNNNDIMCTWSNHHH